MFELKGFKKKGANFLCRMVPDFKRAQHIVFNPLEIWKSAKSIMLCTPFKMEDFEVLLPMLNSLFERLPEYRFGLVVLENFKDWALKAVNCQVITIAKDDVGFFKLPRRKIRKYFRNNKYDIAIDFNRGGTVFSAILCALCGAGIRIGFAGGGSERFLNYLISPQSGVAEERFRALLSYVGMS